MVRKLRHHEAKLLRKVDFVTYKSDNNHLAADVCRRYHVQKPADYTSYNRLCGSLRSLAHKLAALEPSDPARRKHEELLLGKLFEMGILGTGGGGRGKLSDVEHKVTVSSFCRRR
jgi:U3 small nucleolar ribonucleoprotein protein IMP3